MHIKQVILEGFRTYKSRTVIPFTPGANAIVGFNGSGKSNVFDAIEFVLSDKYSNMRLDERQQLLHEGTGQQSTSASVEIIFDNSDGRIPVERKESVSLKRTMGAKKDEYFLDQRHMTKSDVVNLLESAGMSRSNPYYIVQQGKVSKLIKMRDSERLELLMDIAGTRTYDERREESLRIMQQTDRQRAAIDEVIVSIERRLNELEGERKALKEYQNWDSERRSLEYALHQRRTNAITERINALDVGQTASRETSSKLHQEAAAATTARQQLEDRLRQISEQRISLAARAGQLEEQRQQMSANLALATLRYDSLAEQEKSDTDRAKRLERELRALEQQIEQKEKEATKAANDCAALLAEEQALQQRVTLAEQRSLAISARLGRATQFKSKTARDKHLKEQIKSLEREAAAEEAQIAEVHAESKSAKSTMSNLTQSMEKLKQTLVDMEIEMKSKRETVDVARAQLETEQNARRTLWMQQEQLENATQGVRAAHEQANRALLFAADREVLRGTRSVKAFAEEHKIKGVHGPLIELFQTERPIFDACVEAVGGNSLFHVVVDNDEIAARIVNHLNETKGGRVTFIPLNRARVDKVQYPPVNEGIAMIDKLQFSEAFRPALFQVFGRTVIVRDLKTGGDISRLYNLDCITTSCERVSRRGAFTGGYQEPGASLKIIAVQKLQQCTTELTNSESALTAAQQAVLDKDQLITSLMNTITRLSEDRARLNEQARRIRQNLDDLERELRDLSSASVSLESRLSAAEGSAQAIQDRLKLIREELSSPFEVDSTAVAKDEKELEDLTKEIDSLREELAQTTTARAEAQLRRDTEEAHLTRYLLRKQAELREDLVQSSADTLKTSLAQAKLEVETLKQRLDEIEAEISRASEEAGRLKSEFEREQSELDTKRAEELRLIRQLSESTQAADQIIGRRAMLEKQREECQRAIQELGMLNTSKLAEYMNKPVRTLETELEDANGRLKQFTHVNKKAIDQYLNFRQRREELHQRKEELDKGRNAIIDLIESLDLKKDEAIDRTFKAIGLQFSLAFQELVPHGKGTLVLQTRAHDSEVKAQGDGNEDEGNEVEDEERKSSSRKAKSNSKARKASSNKKLKRSQEISDDDEDEEAEEEQSLNDEGSEEEADVGDKRRRRRLTNARTRDEVPAAGSAMSDGAESKESKAKIPEKPLPLIAQRSSSTTLKYTGVGIRVSFGQRDSQSKDSGADVSTTSTSLLSGGQQSVVALALIFAIQRCDPSPFYLFDEIDANLDAVHRTAVARMINKLKPTTQFIYTTFRPELLQVGDHFAGVRFADRTSQVRLIAKREAEDLVQSQSQAIVDGQTESVSTGRGQSRKSNTSRVSIKV